MPIIGRNIIPSSLGLHATPKHHDGDVFSNTRLRMGEVQEIVYPNDAKSLSKKFVEYTVFVQHRGNGTGVGKMYHHCVSVSAFGGLADQCHYTLRADTTPSTKKKGSKGLGLGSKVLLLCINGETNNAVILGGLRDQSDVSGFAGKEAKDLGHYFYFNFNGVSAYIDNDGQFLLTYNGKTGVDGKTDVDKGSRGTRMGFLKDGSWNVNTRDPNDPDNSQEQFMFLDHANHQTIHQAKKLWQVQVGGKAKFSADDGVHLNDATDFMLLGSSFRDAQKTMHSTIKGLCNSLQGLIQTAGAQMTAGTAANATPIVGGILAAPMFTAAAAALTAAAPLLGQLAQAIDLFEQQGQAKNGYLSQKHKND